MNTNGTWGFPWSRFFPVTSASCSCEISVHTCMYAALVSVKGNRWSGGWRTFQQNWFCFPCHHLTLTVLQFVGGGGGGGLGERMNVPFTEVCACPTLVHVDAANIKTR